MIFETRNPRQWRQTFAVFPVPLYGGSYDPVEKAWLQTVEKCFPNWRTTNGPIAAYRPVGSDREPIDEYK